jgi:hypothetical protein
LHNAVPRMREQLDPAEETDGPTDYIE